MNDEQAIAALLTRYEQALNASSTEQSLALYAPDAVFMPQHAPSSIGTEALTRAYDAVFATITLAVKFDVQEIHLLTPEWAFARTNSAGTTTVHATGATGPEANQELFLFRKLDGEWKIARYCFCTTNPPRA